VPDATLTTRLYLVRHGATPLTAEDRFSGAAGVDLSDEGRWQADRLGARLRREGISAVYASPLSRTVETARRVAGPCGLAPVLRDGLREISHGHWEGLTRGEVEVRFADEYAAWQEDPFTFAPDGGESGAAVLARALPVVREVVTRHPGERVVVVAHKATLRLVLSSLLGFDARLPRPPRPGTSVPQRGRLPRPGARAPHAVQRHVALRRPAAGSAPAPLALVGRGPDGRGA
jgi:probable phosphoglycerate mutase